MSGKSLSPFAIEPPPNNPSRLGEEGEHMKRGLAGSSVVGYQLFRFLDKRSDDRGEALARPDRALEDSCLD
jgi:hypothetical protein